MLLAQCEQDDRRALCSMNVLDPGVCIQVTNFRVSVLRYGGELVHAAS